VLSDEAKAYTLEITARMADVFSRARPRVVAPAFRTETLRVEIRWYRKQRSGDVDKRGAILLDALQGLAYTDDRQIADYRIVRDDSQPKQARMVVTIQPMGEG
jgi:Holliday junction resolvase RusA-like endonuclease